MPFDPFFGSGDSRWEIDLPDIQLGSDPPKTKEWWDDYFADYDAGSSDRESGRSSTRTTTTAGPPTPVAPTFSPSGHQTNIGVPGLESGLDPISQIASEIFSNPDGSRIVQVGTHTAEQQDLLSQLIGHLSGNLGPDIDSETTSLEGLEQIALGGGSSGPSLDSLVKQFQGYAAPDVSRTRQSVDALLGSSILGPDSLEDYYTNVVEDPLRERYDDLRNDIGRRFSGNALFDTERGEADARAVSDFGTALERGRSRAALEIEDLGLRRQTAAADAALRALTGIGDQTYGRAQTSYEAGQQRTLQRDLARQQIAAELAGQRRSTGNQNVENILAALNTPGFENIAFGAPDKVEKSGGGFGGAVGAIIDLFL